MAAILALTLCPDPACQHLTENNLQTHLEADFVSAAQGHHPIAWSVRVMLVITQNYMYLHTFKS